MYNILICDDEKDIVNALSIYLADPNYELFTASNGQQALQAVMDHEIHLVLLDVMMPVMDGYEAMRKIREISNVPIILLTAKSEDMDKILGLSAGADDYVTKPFNPLEVAARVRSQLRRYLMLGSKQEGQEILVIGGIELNDINKTVTVDGNAVSLTPKEFDILKFFMNNPGRVYSTKAVYETIWREKSYGGENTVAVHIRHLREKIEINPSEPRYLKVVFGQGYLFEAEKKREGCK